jgi:hypothetical protein
MINSEPRFQMILSAIGVLRLKVCPLTILMQRNFQALPEIQACDGRVIAYGFRRLGKGNNCAGLGD